MIISIRPVPAYPSSGTQLEVSDGLVELGNTASFLYTLLNSSGTQVGLSRRSALTTGQYAAWIGEDSFVAHTIASGAGFSVV